jgi:hypothetical protein
MLYLFFNKINNQINLKIKDNKHLETEGWHCLFSFHNKKVLLPVRKKKVCYREIENVKNWVTRA